MQQGELQTDTIYLTQTIYQLSVLSHAQRGACTAAAPPLMLQVTLQSRITHPTTTIYRQSGLLLPVW
jgi:hypothetical protein